MQKSVILKSLVDYFDLKPHNDCDVPVITVQEVVSDSRIVQSGDIFFAWKGGSFDSHKFIPDAVKNGAIAIVGTEELSFNIEVPYFKVEDSRYTLAGFAAYINDFPARKMTIIGVTGTDGKTTTTNYIYHILLAAGIKAGMISTVNAVIGDQAIDTGFHVTTPESPQVQQYLRLMAESGVTHVVLETTSHGLAQQRVAFCDYNYAVVTNITHEHLDYHGSYEGYIASKAILFEYVAENSKQNSNIPYGAVLNKLDKSYSTLKGITNQCRQFIYAVEQEADFWADEIVSTDNGIDFALHYENNTYPVHTNLKGEFNVWNCLAAIALTHGALGLSLDVVQNGLNRVEGLIGRMDEVNLGQPYRAFVDFAHTPFGLEAALKSGRKLTSKRLIAIFGSAGLRDKLKRRMMSEISADLADVTILTAEDPRIESLSGILDEMSQAMLDKGKQPESDFYVVPDRGEALRFAVSIANPGDIVMACGKGHEQSMCFGETEYPWDEKTALTAAISQQLGISGPDMPYLPTQASDFVS
jgi:UDP-N-acetylmuramoyl-L-alanyl-D-glutamate--2,6-diaminopimelate ligase